MDFIFAFIVVCQNENGMKVFISFMCGVIVCSLFLFGVRLIVPALADEPLESSENTSGLAALIPDIETIYRQALLMPFEKAAKKIYDPDIAEYYSELLDRAGLKSDTAVTP